MSTLLHMYMYNLCMSIHSYNVAIHLLYGLLGCDAYMLVADTLQGHVYMQI